ncbi:MAG: PIN domain-containing protein [Actinomycetota bacterium]|nr:PIN domain-containing protein [Actinomycetota bacterium]MDQ3527303.1 PIN domain-containing protein [Actinomycetota bacterium]
MIALDASVLVAYLFEQDAHHDDAVRWVETWGPGSTCLSALTLAECLVLPTRAGRAETVVDLLAGWETVVLPVTVEDAVGLARLRAGSGLRMPDCVVVHAAMTVGAQLATFDSRLADVARSRGLSVVT